MNDIEIKLIKFLLTAAAYSDTAAMKNLGITEEELKEIYISLEEKGYLESYAQYEARNPKTGCSGGCCESRDCSSCNKCGGGDIDYSKIKVITQKAIDEFDN